jgi:hypothetical protein
MEICLSAFEKCPVPSNFCLFEASQTNVYTKRKEKRLPSEALTSIFDSHNLTDE